MKIRTIGAIAVLVLTLGACGGGDDEKASKSLSASIMDSNDETFEVTQEQADCVGDGFVEEIGTDKLVEYEVLKDDLSANEGIENVEMSEDDAGSAADVMLDCVDIKEVFTSSMGELPAEAKACFEENLTDDLMRGFLVALFQGDEDGGTQELMTALTECMSAGG